jgi:hypothetical protein
MDYMDACDVNRFTRHATLHFLCNVRVQLPEFLSSLAHSAL